MGSISSISTGHHAALLGLGAYRPHRVVTNEEVCEHLEVDAEWVHARSGISTRRMAGPEETVVAMGAAAARDALAAAGVAPADVAVTLVATMSADTGCPQVGTRLAAEIGAVNGAAMDVGAACAGFCYALEVAASLVDAGHGAVLVVGVERMSDIVEPTDRSTAFLFGDGAGAVVVGPSTEPGIGPAAWGADGTQAGLIAQSVTWAQARETGERPALRMQGPTVFRWATSRMVPLVFEALEKAGCKPEQLDAFVPHQANARITDGLVKALGLPDHVTVARDVAVTGNTSAASVPLAMHEVLTTGAARPGDLALLCGFGAGLTFASQVVCLPACEH
ncbi:beta-ketoacyl-ACP synthase 3 [Actinomycetospora sp. NBRC 106378]|uniref:beta-ketoacyl-ACP synthase 3 n=1 Tax=Actinomycetospora sp. NBRC 106378 TaxID=3032208 RepID=UPI0024A12751|nr:beta-ketoacyl-ACP synthase 3 [Actinomycetospora sp. NBRC 106378]GLZ51868.1 3-oxoacyl-[acyl-carrier-protein] synthase 3 protein 1 [Actinomycetospora sp. NBRC 106378]